MIVRRALPVLLVLPLAAACSGGTAPAASAPAAPSASAASSAPASAPAGAAGTPGAAQDGPVPPQGPEQLLAAARANLVSAGSVHLSGSITEPGSTLSVDMRVNRQGGHGHATMDGQTVDTIALGNVVYFRAGAAVYRAQGVGAAARLLGGHWVKGTSTTKGFEELTSFNRLEGMSKDLLNPTGRLRSGPPTTRGGQRVVGLTDATGDTLYVTANDPVRPFEIAAGDATRGPGLRFTEYGVPVTLKAPANALDLAELSQAGH